MPSTRLAGWLAFFMASMGLALGVRAQSPSPAERGALRRAASFGHASPIPLKPGAEPARTRASGSVAPPTAGRTIVTVIGGLGAVLGAFLVLAWIMRRGMPGVVGLLPRDALEVLGRAPLAGRQQVHLIRLGSKLVLISVTPAGAETLSEVTEPEEVQRLLGLCRQGQPTSATSLFRHALERFAIPREASDG